MEEGQSHRNRRASRASVFDGRAGAAICRVSAPYRRISEEAQEQVEYNMHGLLKTLSYVIAILVVVAIFYSGYISVKYWAGIGV